MVTLFTAEVGVMMWLLVGSDLLSNGLFLTSSCFSRSQTLVSTTGTSSEYLSVTGYYHNDVEMCNGSPVLLSMQFSPYFLSGLLSSIQGSIRGHQEQLVDTLIQGNVIYFLWCAFTCSH